MPVELFKRDPDLWKTQNQEWLKNRKNEWKEIVRRLSAVPHWISNKQLKDNQRYFIYGDTEFKCNVHIGKDRYPDNTWRLKEIILQIWYYPGDITAEDIQPCSDYRAKINTQRDDWYKAIAEIRRAISRDDTGYGLMGGRERIVTEYLNPTLDYKAKYQFSPNIKGNGCLSPSELFGYCAHATTLELRNFKSKQSMDSIYSGSYVKDLSGIYLWNHLDHVFEHYMNELYLLEPTDVDYQMAVGSTERSIDELLSDVVCFFDRKKDDEALARPHTVSFVEQLHGKYENKEFSPSMMMLWDSVKKRTGHSKYAR